jgi:hypothetical protein
MSPVRRTLFVIIAILMGLPAAAASRDLNSELIYAARQGRLAMIQSLITEGADVNGRRFWWKLDCRAGPGCRGC